jgi:hypothetical protein
MAPEIWDGKKAIPASDIYALSCVVFEMLTGKVLFEGSSMAAVTKQHIVGPQFPEEWPEGTPEGVTDILQHGLMEDPNERINSGGRLAKELAALSASVVSASPPVTKAGLPLPAKKQIPWLWGSVGVVVLVVVFAIFFIIPRQYSVIDDSGIENVVPVETNVLTSKSTNTPIPPTPTEIPTKNPLPPILTSQPPIIEGEYYNLIVKQSGKCLDVIRSNKSDGANVIQFNCEYRGDNQKWMLMRVEGEYYKIVVKHSGKCLDVEAGGISDGANVIQFDCRGGDNQKWKLVSVENNEYYNIIAKHSGKCLSFTDSEMGDVANVVQFDCEGSEDSKNWRFVLDGQ